MRAASGLGCALLLAIAGVSTPARAHEAGLSRGEYSVDGARVRVTYAIATRELRTLARQLDGDDDGALSEAELLGASAVIRERVVDGVAVTSDAGPCASELAAIRFAGDDGVDIDAVYQCRAPVVELHLGVRRLLEYADPGHRHVAVVSWPDAEPQVFAGFFGQLEFHARSPAPAPVAPPPVGDARPADDAPPPAPAPRHPSAPAYLLLGVEHILLGLDHLVFLLGVMLARGRARELLAVITAFTIGHSLSLAIITLGGHAPDPRWVEPAIALSIAYVGLENFWRDELRGRWKLTLPFGLLHGLGFAGALSAIGVPKDDAWRPLLLFNLGVELGQLIALTPALALLWLARRTLGSHMSRVRRALSAGVLIAGVTWLIARTLAWSS
ncbi:MAG: HupE/UreJ family protein [Myxococcales bacterium]|nr:HupE/UreJ family protein [Myxococcales bacterium]